MLSGYLQSLVASKKLVSDHDISCFQRAEHITPFLRSAYLLAYRLQLLCLQTTESNRLVLLGTGEAFVCLPQI